MLQVNSHTCPGFHDGWAWSSLATPRECLSHTHSHLQAAGVKHLETHPRGGGQGGGSVTRAPYEEAATPMPPSDSGFREMRLRNAGGLDTAE